MPRKEKPVKFKPKSLKTLKAEALFLWSRCVRSRDNFTCQWCGTTKKTQAHHIVARSLSNIYGWFAINNGITLCMRCHMYEIQKRPDEYIIMRNIFLGKQGKTYNDLLQCYSKTSFAVKYTKEMYESLIKNLNKFLFLNT